MKIHHKSKRALPPLPQVAELINKLTSTPNDDLAQVLSEIPAWKWPRSDLNAWVRVLNKFDGILEEVIRDYEVDKLQVNVFTPLTKKTVCEILRFERMLLENSTNRKTFNSYDRLNSLMLTSDLDVLVYTLTLILRPSQQYSAQPSVAQALNISTQRLQCLTKRWSNLRECGVNLVDLVTEKGKQKIDTLPPDARDINFSFYRQEPSQSKTQDHPAESETIPDPALHATSSRKPSSLPQSGAINIHIDRQTLQAKPEMHILADAIEAFSIPDDAKFELMCRIRTALVLTQGKEVDREKLVIVRMLAIAIFCHTHNEGQGITALFLPEPDLINHIAELLQLDRGVPIAVQTAAISALDATARYRNKIQEVLTAVNAGVNHGTLMSLMRKTAADAANADSTLPHSFIEALLALVTFLASHAAGGNMVVAAGLIPLLIQVIDNRLPERLLMVSKTMQLVDNVLYGFTNAFQLFCNNKGVEALVDRIEYEVDSDIKEYGGDRPSHHIPVSYGKLPVPRAAVLKHILRSMHRMMQTSGTTEGLRGLIDSSLLKSIKKVIESRSLFGPSILPFAINIMATFVHNEPTSLTIIQEVGIPEAFYKVVESGVEPAFEVIQAVPNAIGALCLNQTGQDQLAARPTIIPGLFSIFTSERHQRVLQDKENAVLIGTSIDELIRHHPFLKESVFEAVRSTLGRIEDLGNAYVVPADIRQWYQLIPDSSVVNQQAQQDEDVAMDIDVEPNGGISGEAVGITDETASESAGDKEESSVKSHDNHIVSFIDVVGRFLEGLFQHPHHCKDFVTNTDGLERIGRLTGLPCLPYDFANSVASDSLVQVIRTMVEAATGETLGFLVKLVKQSLGETEEFWKVEEQQSRSLSLLDITSEQQEYANQRWRNLVTLNIRTTMLSDLYSTAGYAHGRGSANLLQALIGRNSPGIIEDLGNLHRACVWENIVFKSGLRLKGVDPSPVPALDLSDATQDSTAATLPQIPVASIDGAASSVANGDQLDSEQSTMVSGVTSPRKEEKKEDTPRSLNVKALSHVLNQIPSSLAPLFQAFVKLFYTRRAPDSVTKQRILDASALVADVVLKHLGPKDYDDKLSLFTYYTVMMGLLSVLVVDERTTQTTLHTVLLVAIGRIGGLEAIFDITRRFIESANTISQVKSESRTAEAKEELVHAYGGLKVALHLIHPLISSKPLFEATQTTFLINKDRARKEGDFDPHDFLITLRLAALPVLRDIWTSTWLTSAPLSVCKSVVQTVLELLNTEGEEPSSSGGGNGIGEAPAAATRQVPDENRIRQLTDMGFPRASVERALLRTHNNIPAATDLLLSQPFLPALDTDVYGAAVDTESQGTTDSEEPGPWERAVEPSTAKPADETPEDRRKELSKARENLVSKMPQQALHLLDEHSSLVFDVHRAFTATGEATQEKSINLLIDDIKTFSPSAYDIQEQPLAVRCRLLAIIFADVPSSIVRKVAIESKNLMGDLLALLLSDSMNGENPTPKWLAAHLLVAESLLTMGEEPRRITMPKSEEDPLPEEDLVTGPTFLPARSILFDFCIRLLSNHKPSKDEQLSCLRLLVVLTRDHETASRLVSLGGVELLLQCMRTKLDVSSMAGHHSYITTILRHVAEDPAALQNIMQREIRRFITHPRNRALDAASYVRHCSAMAFRDPKTFIRATDEVCQLFSPFMTAQNINIKKSLLNVDTATQKPSEKSNVDSEMQVDEQAPSAIHTEFSDNLEAVVHFLINELMKMAKTGATELISVPNSPAQDSARSLVAVASSSTTLDIGIPSSSSAVPAGTEATNGTPDAQDGFNNYAYSCFLMQVLTELLFSYDSCKLAFLSYSPKKKPQTPLKDTKYRTAALQFFLSDLVSFGTINSQPTPEARRRIMLCNWAMSVVVALCVDTSAGHDLKDVPADLVSVRKFVLEAISRSIKDLPLSGSVDSRYARLLALTDLCFRLLTVRFNAGARKSQEEAPTHIAKVMLEKNFVATLTNAIGDIDLNYPNIRTVVTSVLKPMEYLTKVAIKMSRASGKTKDSIEDKEDSAESDMGSENDDVAEEPREETPDLYRNSSLGMYGGEMEDVHFGAEDNMDEDEVDEDEDVEMDFAEDTGSEDTSRTEDDDDEHEDEDVDADTGESEGAWQDEDDDEEDLVENDAEPEVDDEEDDEDEDEPAGEAVIWQEGEAVPEHEEVEEEEELGGGVTVVRDEQDEDAEWMSEAEEYAEELGVLEARDNAPQFTSIFGIANPFGDAADGNARGAQQILWSGGRRATEEMDVFGRPGSVPSAPEATTHPLLLDTAAQRISQTRTPRRLNRSLLSDLPPSDLLATLENLVGSNTAVQFLQHFLSHVRTGSGGEAIHVDVPAGALIQMDPQFLNQRHPRGHMSAAIRVERAPRPGDPRREERDFNPLGTIQRWSEEAKILHGKYASERLTNLTDHVVLRLLPVAIQAEKELKAAREKELAEIREMEARAEAEDKASSDAKSSEESKEEAAGELAPEAAQEPVVEPHIPETTDLPAALPADTDTEMLDAPPAAALTEQPAPSAEEPSDTNAVGETASEASPAEQAESSAAVERVTIMIHGAPVDITDTGIDPTFLEALPDEMREDVINQHVRDQRAARVERPADSQISPEFLDALPPDIRAEILQQERAEQVRRRAEENRTGNTTAPAEIDNADFIASLDPHLREVVLLDQDDGFIRTLPSHMIAEAQGYREGSHRHHRHRNIIPPVRTPASIPRPIFVPRDAIQLLDKSSIAILVRLLFFPQVLKKNILFKVLLHLCENAKTRTELFNVLLSILQDGSGDLAAMDKSFAHMSFRNTRTPQSSKMSGKQKAISDYSVGFTLPSDIVPELRARRCLEALTFIVSSNELSSLFFLTEHELPLGLRKSTSKKGKGKEKQVSPMHYPIVLLLSLLDRESLLKTSSIMESVVGLLASVTRPLTSLKDAKKDGDAQPSTSTNQAQPESAETVPSAPNTTTTDEPPPNVPTQPSLVPPTNSEDPKPDDTSEAAGEKILLANPPQIPQPVLRSIVNILTVGECSGRTFQQTLALIQHISCIPDAQDVIAQELKSRAQEFGKTLYSDLDELARTLQISQIDALAGSIASKFSSASSDQAKLLRVLKTIDYMYSSKSPTATPPTSTDEGAQQIQSIYETFKFSALWRRLGDCLILIEKPELDHIATVLLPLIECLMVVCKYVGTKSVHAIAARAARASASPKSPISASESMEDLFVLFTDTHRKILNVMVRNNPSLMSGSFSLLVHNPRVLDFDNKRNYFNQQLHRRPHTREHHATLQLNVRRQRVFEDSFQYLQRKSGEQIKHGKLSIRFYDEEGVDAGGVTREWFQILARQMFNPNYALFQPCAADRLTYQPNKASAVNPEHLSFFKFVGRVIGKAIYDGRLLDAYFARSLYRQLLGKPVDYRDVEWVDPEYYNSLCWILENDPSPLDMTFSFEVDEFGVTKIISLKENGEKIPVTLENRKEFVQLSAQYRLYSSIKEQIESLLGGFYEIVPKDLVSIFNEQEVELLISGTPDIDVDEWRAATEYNGYTSSDPVIVWWWRALKSFNREERAKVLSFATGTSRVPLGGFVELQGVQGVQRFSIHRAYGDSDRLPQAHTCFNQIDLPQYSSYEMLRQQLLLAINEGGEGFGFA